MLDQDNRLNQYVILTYSLSGGQRVLKSLLSQGLHMHAFLVVLTKIRQSSAVMLMKIPSLVYAIVKIFLLRDSTCEPPLIALCISAVQ